jgi:hypothetical protein
MDFLSNFMGGMASVASGGIFGLLGSIIGVGAKYFQEKQRQSWQQKKWLHETKLLELQMQARATETEQELAIVSQEGAWAGLRESHRTEQSIKNVHVWVNDIRALFRPVLTIFLWVIAAWIFWLVVGGSLIEWLKEVDIKDILRYMIFSVFFSASTATVWWFGDRALSPPGHKNR